MPKLDNLNDEQMRPDEDRSVPDASDAPDRATPPREGVIPDQDGFPFDDLSASGNGEEAREEIEKAEDLPLGVPADVPTPPWTDDTQEPREPRRPPRAATYVALAIVVLALLGVLMTIASVHLYLKQQQAVAALRASVDRLAVVYAAPGASETAQRRIAWLRKALAEDDYAQAQKAILSLQRPETTPPEAGGGAVSPDLPGPGGVTSPDHKEPPTPMEASDLPPGAQQFFSEHEELWKAFFGFTRALVQLRRAGAPIDELAEMRASMIEAARTGRADRVEELLDQARKKLEVGLGENLPEALKEKLQRFGQAFQRAQRQHRDVRRAAELARRSEQAAREGDFQRAEALLDEATTALRRAPRAGGRALPMSGRRRGMPPIGPELGFLRFVSQLFAGVMKAEDQDLTQIWESINIAADAIREHNAEQIREILGKAKDALRHIGERRRKMSATLQQAEGQVRSPHPPSAEQQRQRTEVVLSRISAIIDRVRELSPEQYQAAREQIARDLLRALMAPVPTGEPLSEAERAMTPEQRVRAKMRIAGEMYVRLKTSTDADLTELNERFEEARRLITEHKYEEAEGLVDAGVAIMRDMMAQAERRAVPPDAGPTDLPDEVHIDLRGIGSEPIVAPPPAIAPQAGGEHTTSEESEQ